MNNLPLYPQEAYSEQNNARSFIDEKSEQTPINQNKNQNASPLLPLILKLLSGGGANALNSLGGANALNSLGGDNPIFNLISSLSNNKKTPPKQEGEKDFPN